MKLLTTGANAVRSSSKSYDQIARDLEALTAAGKDVDVAALEAISLGNEVGKLLMNVHLTSMAFKQLWSGGYIRQWAVSTRVELNLT